MGFRGQEFAFDSPAAAVAGLISHLTQRDEDGTVVGMDGGAGRTSETIPLAAACGRICAHSVACDRDSPAFDYASMDGYAVRAADVLAAAAYVVRVGGSAVTLTVVGESRIGAAPPPLTMVGLCAESSAPALRIATGAPVPSGEHGADAIIKREDVTELEAAEDNLHRGVRKVTLTLEVAKRVIAGEYIRQRGENARMGDEVIPQGEILSAASLGALAAVGCATPRVFSRLRIAVITTGDELVTVTETPGPYQIRNSNAASVGAVLSPLGWVEVVQIAHLTDDANITAALREAMEPPIAAEAIIVTGGVSMGHRDPVRAAVEGVGAEIIFHGLPQRPGKPMLAAMCGTCGTRGRHNNTLVPIFGLPGNPVSAMVTCTRIVLPVLARLAGACRTPAALLPRLVPLANDDHKQIGLWWHRPVTLHTRDDGVTIAHIVDTRGSGDVISAARSDGFVELPPATQPLRSAGSEILVPFYPWPA